MINAEIKQGETFPFLVKAPVQEAVIQLSGRAGVDWEEQRITASLKERLPLFSKTQSLRGMMAEMRLQQGTTPSNESKDLGWLGLVMRPDDEKQVLQFQRDFFAYSRLSPYPGWDSFLETALTMWKVHQEVAAPSEVVRVGIRFINRIDLPIEGKLENYLNAPPIEPVGMDFPYLNFLHSETLTDPSREYAIQITKTIQPSIDQDPFKFGLIIDIDVFTLQSLSIDTDALILRLEKMRSLKNMAFFGSLKQDFINQLK